MKTAHTRARADACIDSSHVPAHRKRGRWSKRGSVSRVVFLACLTMPVNSLVCVRDDEMQSGEYKVPVSCFNCLLTSLMSPSPLPSVTPFQQRKNGTFPFDFHFHFDAGVIARQTTYVGYSRSRRYMLYVDTKSYPIAWIHQDMPYYPIPSPAYRKLGLQGSSLKRDFQTSLGQS